MKYDMMTDKLARLDYLKRKMVRICMSDLLSTVISFENLIEINVEKMLWQKYDSCASYKIFTKLLQLL